MGVQLQQQAGCKLQNERQKERKKERNNDQPMNLGGETVTCHKV